MMQNSEYNNGNPYFVSFRPLLHNVVRLSDKELAQYADYNAKIERLEKMAAELKAAKVDVFDIELDSSDPDEIINIVRALAPTFGGINLEDIKAPECFFKILCEHGPFRRRIREIG